MITFMYTLKYYAWNIDTYKCGKSLTQGKKGYMPT